MSFFPIRHVVASSSTDFSLSTNWAFAACISFSLQRISRNWSTRIMNWPSNTIFWCSCCRWLVWIVFEIWNCWRRSQPQRTSSHSLASYWLCAMFWLDCHLCPVDSSSVKLPNSRCSSAPHCSQSRPWVLSLHWKVTWRHRNRSDRNLECWTLECCSSRFCMRHLDSWAIGGMDQHRTKVSPWIYPKAMCKCNNLSSVRMLELIE